MQRVRGTLVLLLAAALIPSSIAADIEIPPESASLAAEHAGIEVTDVWVNDELPIIDGAELSGATGEWGVKFIRPKEAAPADRAVYVLARVNTFDEDIVQEYAYTHAAIPNDGDDETIDSQTVTFNGLPLFGDPTTLSGYYRLFVFQFPDTKLFCEEVEPFDCFDQPYTDEDFVNWFHWQYEVDYSTFEGEAPITYAPDQVGRLSFEYVAGEAPGITIDPVIIIPGILGSEQNSDGEWVIDPILHTYDDLIATLDVNYYTPGVDLFTFPYNWRKSNVETATLLKQKIDEVKSICGCGKVDIVAHSMGGLVARQYIQSDAYEDDVDQLIFLGTPHLGAPKAYLMWEGGELGPTNIFEPLSSLVDGYAESMLTQEAHEKGYDTLFAYIQNNPIPSVQELLPIYDYIFDGADLRNYSVDYPENGFLEDLNGNVNNLFNAGVEIHNIVGDTSAQQTITGITVVNTDEYAPLWPHGYPEDYYSLLGNHGLQLGDGDGTVPLPSASFINSNLLTLPYAHNPLPLEAEGDVYYILTNQVVGILTRKYDSAVKKLLHIKMMSPADLLVVAPDGKKVGKENGISINQIPDAFYTGFNTETEFITILNPLDGEYKIITQGTDAGSYTVETNYISDAMTTAASYTGETAPGAVAELQLAVDNQNPAALEIIAPDATPPIITIASPAAKDYSRSEQLLVNISAEDESGVLALETNLDGTVIPNTGTLDLFFKSLGSHVLIASSTDMVGNATTSSRAFRIVATATSTIADFERAYALGWMTKKTHDALIKKIKAIVVIRKTIKNIVQTIVETGRNGKKTTKNVQKKIEIAEEVLDKVAAKAILKELDKYRGKGLDERAYQLLKEDVQWLINS